MSSVLICSRWRFPPRLSVFQISDSTHPLGVGGKDGCSTGFPNSFRIQYPAGGVGMSARRSNVVRTATVVSNSATKWDIGLDQTRSNSSWRVNRCSIAIKLYEECGLSHDGDTTPTVREGGFTDSPFQLHTARRTDVVRWSRLCGVSTRAIRLGAIQGRLGRAELNLGIDDHLLGGSSIHR